MPIKRSLAATAAVALTGATLSVLAGTTTSASAACAPSVVPSVSAHAQKRVKVKTTVAVKKVKRHRYVASGTVTATQGSAAVSVTETVCPDGAAGGAVSRTGTSTGVGQIVKKVSAKGATKAAAKAAAKAKAAKAAAKLKKQGATKRGVSAAKARATAAATPLAAKQAHDALYLSDVFYVTVGSDGLMHSSPTASGGTSITRAANGDIVLGFPAEPSFSGGVPAPCIRRAAAWPTQFLFDGGTATSPVLSALAKTEALDGGAYVYTNVYTVIDGKPRNSWDDQYWEVDWDNGSPTPTEVGMYDTTPSASTAVCFEADSSIPAAFTVTLSGARAGSAAGPTPDTGRPRATGGVPVSIR